MNKICCKNYQKNKLVLYFIWNLKLILLNVTAMWPRYRYHVIQNYDISTIRNPGGGVLKFAEKSIPFFKNPPSFIPKYL